MQRDTIVAELDGNPLDPLDGTPLTSETLASNRALKSELESHPAVVGLRLARLQSGDPNEPPLWLCCPLTLELFEDPVLTRGGGHTYERAALLAVLAVRREDPLDRRPLSEADCCPNIAVRLAAEAFRKAHPVL
jgi:hypothetical protein